MKLKKCKDFMAEAPNIKPTETDDIGVQFLQEALPDKDWRTTVTFPDNSPASLAKLQALHDRLSGDSRYLITDKVNAQNQPVMQIHHMGHDTRIATILQEMGPVRGLGYMAAHPVGMAAKTGTAIGKAARELGNDPARLNGFIFTFAEFFLATAGIFGNSKQPIPHKLQPMRKRANLLQTVAGNLFLGQSLIYLLLARSNDEIAMDQVRHKVKAKLENGSAEAIENIAYNPQTDKSNQGVFGAIGGFIRRYPIQIGALFNVTGMFVYIAHVLQEKKLLHQVQEMKPEALAALNIKLPKAKALTQAADYIKKAGNYVEKGWRYGIMGCAASIVAWTMMMMPHKQRSPEERRKDRGNLFGPLKDNPQLVTGALAVVSSSSRLVESLSPGKLNLVQAVGEAIYIPGDLLLMAIHNDEYGDSRKSKDKLAKQLVQYIQEIPLAIGPQSQKALVENIGTFLEQKAADEMAALPPGQRISETQLKEQIQRTVYLVRSQLQRHEKPFDKLVESGIRMVNDFPEEVRPALRDKLIGAMSEIPWVHATPQELRMAFESYVPFPEMPRLREERDLNLRSDIGAIASIIPTADAAATATKLLSVVQPFLTPSPKISVQGAARDALAPAMQPALQQA